MENVMKESKARYKITEELTLTGETLFWVYKKRPMLTFFFSKYSWVPKQCFHSLAGAEEYVQRALAYEESAENPKMVRYF
jgi:hypothetical protein